MARSIVWTPISRSTRPHHRLQRSVLESRRTHLLFRRQLVGRNLGLRLRPRHGCRVQQAHVLQNRSFAGRRRRRRTLQDGTHPQRNNQGCTPSQMTRPAYVSGVRRDLVRSFAFAVSSACASVGGLMLISQTLFANATAANGMLLPAIVGVVVGGTAISGGVGGVTASVVGGLFAILIRVGAPSPACRQPVRTSRSA
jgi:hypothetical protein